MSSESRHIPFSRPLLLGTEADCLQRALSNQFFSGNGPIAHGCEQRLKELCNAQGAVLTPSCTHALELAALLCETGPGDEVLLPAYAFSSTANAFAMRGATPVFVDVRPEDMNINPRLLEQAISPRTKAVVALHYGGMACDMDALTAFAERHQIYLIEDAAQAIGATYRGRPLGSFGHLAALSFHESKNVHCGEGGALLINRAEMTERALPMRNKGTNRHEFLAGKVQAYEWTSPGSAYLMPELNAAFLHTQLQALQTVNKHRQKLWETYAKGLQPLEEAGLLQLPHPLPEAAHNGHLFFIRCRSAKERLQLSKQLSERGIEAYFHYQPLHLSPAGKRYGRKPMPLPVTERESQRLLRLPLYYELQMEDVEYIVHAIRDILGG